MAAIVVSGDHKKLSRSSMRRAVKKKHAEKGESESTVKRRKECERAGCFVVAPLCFLTASHRCAGNGYTSRWYHMSHGEHFCNECFDYYYRCHKDGYKIYDLWKEDWNAEATSEPTLRVFVADQLLPYWVCCMSCKKWRQLPKDSDISPYFISTFQCKSVGQRNSDPCEVAEDLRVAEVFEHNWVDYLTQTPLLKYSPAANYLNHFYPEGIGLSPTSCHCDYSNGNASKWMKPFCQNLSGKSPLYMNPDAIDEEEAKCLAGCARYQSTYLGLRNLILAVWNWFPKEWLSMERVHNYIICRGLARIFLIKEAEKILDYLIRKGAVNYGIILSPEGYSVMPKGIKDEVLIIGAGIAGLSAAKHLQNLGVKVTVVDARPRLGGRIRDENAFKSLTGKGAHIINGVANNPFTIMCIQAGIEMKVLKEKIVLLSHNTGIIPDDIVNRMQFHFSAILDSADEWRAKSTEDISILDKVQELHGIFKKETGIEFTKQEESIFNVFACLLEITTGVTLKHASALHWDHSIPLAQFAGPDAIIHGGYSSILKPLAEGLNVKLNCAVKGINYLNNDIVVRTNKGDFIASKVVVTVPLPILRRGDISFHPPLPESKKSACQQLGDCVFEKVILQFPNKFWNSISNQADVFGIIPSNEQNEMFQIFSDVTSSSEENLPTLVSYICSSTIDHFKNVKDEIIVQNCFNTLRDAFSDKGIIVPSPKKWFVTHWNEDPYSGSSGTFVKVGGSNHAIDDLAIDICSKLYFAGEATYKLMPHSVAGAFLSGLRVASKIIDDILKDLSDF